MISWYGDGKCDQGNNIVECNYDGKDCNDHNKRYPDCNWKGATPHAIGNDICDGENWSAKCGNDGGDCDGCISEDPNQIGVASICDHMTEKCWDIWPEDFDCKKCVDHIIKNVTLTDEDGYTWQQYVGWLGNDYCTGPLNVKECEWDAGDCIEFNEKHPKCDFRFGVGNKKCDMENWSPQCGNDGGDCPGCLSKDPNSFSGTAQLCNHMTEKCEDKWPDGYDCEKCVERIKEIVETGSNKDKFTWQQHVSWLGNGFCDGGNNIPECMYDGGDCIEIREKYPKCELKWPYESSYEIKLGDGNCDQDYKNHQCGNDGGDCDGCLSEDPDQLGDDLCKHMTENCGEKLPDCQKCVDGIKVYAADNFAKDKYTWQHYVSWLGNGFCTGGANYHTGEACGWDAGDCIEYNEKYPKCEAKWPSQVGDGKCHMNNNNIDCELDGGDCAD